MRERFTFSIDGRKQIANTTWYRGEHCNFNPNRENMLTSDAVFKHVLLGWLPQEPLIGPATTVTAFGSCFAAHIRDWLHSRNYTVLTKRDENGYGNAYISAFGEGLVNSCVLRQQFEWAWTDAKFDEELWHGYQAEIYGYDETVRQSTKAILDRTDVFIITLGLSEIWYDAKSGGVFWRAVPKQKFDSQRHKFRVSTVAETKDNIRCIYDLVSRYRPSAKIIFTVSPVPLVATFRPVSCITANSASKAIIRAALDEVMRDIMPEGRAFYWPSYEIVMDVFGNSFRADRRHVKREVLDFIMNAFEHAYCHGTTPRYTIVESWINARAAIGAFPRPLATALAERDLATVDRIALRLVQGENPAQRGVLQLVLSRSGEIGQTDAAFQEWVTRNLYALSAMGKAGAQGQHRGLSRKKDLLRDDA